MQYVTDNVVKDPNFKRSAHYSPVERVVNMDFAEDLNNPRGLDRPISMKLAIMLITWQLFVNWVSQRMTEYRIST